MKAWRRAGGLGASQAPTGPLISSVQSDTTTDVVVTFNQVVLWDSVPTVDLLISGDTMEWFDQVDTITLRATSTTSSGHAPGEPWTMAGPATDIAPLPALGQSGVTVA